jgi:hypothetical protein
MHAPELIIIFSLCTVASVNYAYIYALSAQIVPQVEIGPIYFESLRLMMWSVRRKMSSLVELNWQFSWVASL